MKENEEEEISTKTTGFTQQKQSSAYIEEPIKGIELTAKLTTTNEQSPQPLQINEDAILFAFTVNKEIAYNWNVVKPLSTIKPVFEEIKKEMQNLKTIMSSALTQMFAKVDQWTIDDIKNNIEQLTDYFRSLYEDKTHQKLTSLNEYFEISKSSFNIYNSGSKPKEGYVLKKADPRCWRRIFGYLCKCIECLVFSQYNKRWFVLKDDMICYLNSSVDLVGKNVYWFDDETKVEKTDARAYIITVSNVSRSVILKFTNQFECEIWLKEIQERLTNLKNIIQNNKYKAYTNQKRLNSAKWFVDGESYFKDLQENLLNAKETVFITDWWLSPEVFLVRPVGVDGYMAMEFQGRKVKEDGRMRLMDILNHLARNGVQIYVLLYCEMSLALTLNSKHSKTALVQLHENIKVTRHPKDSLDLLWSHHEKLVIIDQTIGYVGGLDLCWGRYDKNSHPLVEAENRTNTYNFPGIDYSNGRIRDFNQVSQYLIESANRKTEHRMPWHDVHSRLQGPAVADIARHFVERWNYSRFEDRKMAIVDVKQNVSVSHQGVKKKFENKWLGSIIKSQQETEMNTSDPSSIKGEEVDQKEKPLLAGIAPKKSKEKKGNFLIFNQDEEIKTQLKRGMTEQESKDDDDDDDLRKGYTTGKIIIDEDHLMVKEDSSAEKKEERKTEGPKKVSAYLKLVSDISIVRNKKIAWFKEEEKKLYAKFNFKILKKGLCKVQVLRSGCQWSTGISKTEKSILNGYYHLIDNAKHYIYIENQFFVSKPFSEEERKQSSVKLSSVVENEIALHLRLRIERAYRNKEKFHVFIFIPLLPGFAGEPESSSTLQIILKHTLETIANNNGYSLFEKLYDLMGDDVQNYLTFFSLRTHGVISNIPVTELIYIHSKLMIVDDTKVLIGSANINDRSMLGIRDSEYAVIIKESKIFKSTMNGQDYMANQFAATFRRALLAEHLGLAETDPILIDPLDDKFYNLLRSTAKNNTLVYREIFGCYPDDEYTTFQKLRNYRVAKTEDEINQLTEKYQKNIGSIIGHIVEFPTKFLRFEKLGTNFFSVENLIPEKNFT